jgi:hypothetical protein
MMLARMRLLPAIAVFASASVSGCGGDSTGPGSVDPNAALQSLALGLQVVLGAEALTTPEANGSFGGIAPLLDQVNVTIDGASQEMFALGVRQTFPAGTCEETLFIDPSFPPEPGVCTPPQLGLAVILWQAHSGSAPPDRLIFITADTGTSNFDLSTVLIYPGAAPAVSSPAFALYMQGENNVWGALSGTLTSQTTVTTQSCNLPLPPYAKSGTCNIATFDEQGQIVFEKFSLDGQSTDQRVTIGIPHQTVHGLLLAISEVQPVSFPLTANRSVAGMLLTANRSVAGMLRAHSGLAPYLTPAR